MPSTIVSAGAAPSLHGPSVRCVTAGRLAATFGTFSDATCRGARFGLSDCAWDLHPSHGIPPYIAPPLIYSDHHVGRAKCWVRAITLFSLPQFRLARYSRMYSARSRLGPTRAGGVTMAPRRTTLGGGALPCTSLW